MKDEKIGKIKSGFDAAFTVILIATFELVFIADGKYEIVAEWVRYYSRTISIGIVGIFVIVILMSINGIFYKNDKDKIRVYPQTIVSVSLVIIFVIVKIISI